MCCIYCRYIVAHYFAQPLMYPGSVKMLQNLMGINKFNNYLIPYAAWSNLTFEKNV